MTGCTPAGIVERLAAGTVLGAGLGMLFAPKAGSELRNQLGEQAERIKTQATDGYQQATEKVSQIVDKGREAYDRARSGVVVALSIWWKKLTRDGKNANELTSQVLTDIGRAPTFYDVRVELELALPVPRPSAKSE